MKKLLFLLCIFFATDSLLAQSCFPNGLILSTQSEIDSFSINNPDCEIILGRLDIQGNTIENLSGLSQIKRVFGDLSISGSITSLQGLNNLEKIERTLSISGSKIKSLEGLERLNMVDGISISHNDELVSLTGMNALREISTVYLKGNKKLFDLTGFNGLREIGRLEIRESFVKNFVGLEELEVLGTLRVSGDVIENFEGLNNIKTVENILLTNSSIKNFDGLNSLEKITTRFLVDGCDSIMNFQGLGSLTEVRDLDILRLFGLASFQGLSNLTRVGEITIEETNAELIDAFGLVEGTRKIVIQRNNELKKISNFNSLKNVDNIIISRNSQLIEIDAFSNLEFGFTVDQVFIIDIFRNESLSSIKNLGVGTFNLVSIAYNPFLTDIIAFSNLGVSGEVKLIENFSLASIRDLAKMSVLPKRVSIIGNLLLDDCSEEVFCSLNSEATQSFEISNNGNDCLDSNELTDSDNDGIFDICDNCDLSINSSCDDGDPNTINDRIRFDCECRGDCEAETNIGELCDDNNPNTENDVWEENCICKGECVNELDSACDDGNPNTVNDQWSEDCLCIGTCPGEVGASCDDNNENTINDSWTVECECIGDCQGAVGSPCDDGDLATFDDIWNSDCNCAGKPCPPAGTACDDGDPNTIDDIEDGLCECAGVCLGEIGDACDDFDPSTSDDVITEECGCIGTPCIEAGTPCDDDDPNTFNDVEDGNCNCTGTCSFTLGAPCDDGNENTFEDKWTTECICIGECQFIVGSPCDDGNPATENTYWDENCECTGDECEDAGTPCNDSNSLTYGDAINYQCLCQGYYQEAISGFIFHDENENGVLDADEQGIQGVRIDIEGSRLRTYSKGLGDYKFFGDAGAYIIRPELEGCWEATSSSKFAVVSYQSDKIENINFGYKLVDDVIEADTKLTSGRTRCGFTVPFWVNASNTGCETLDLKLELSLSDLTEYNPGVRPLPTSRRNELITWEFENVEPTSRVSAELNLTIAGEDFNHDTIRMVSVISYKDENGEYQPLDSYNYISEISCAIDPNDKQVDPKLIGPENSNYTLFEDKLDYTIRFQNTGSDTAFNIVVRDTLTDLVEWSTFKPGTSSHEFTPVITEDGVVEFHFRDILLPDSTTNYVESQGYVNFTILAIEDIEELEEVKNNAGIFFDFNRPIITNEVNNTLVSTFDADLDGSPFWEDCDDNDSSVYPGAEEIANNEIDEDCNGADFTSSVDDLEILGFKVYPIPSRDVVNITTDVVGDYTLTLFDMMGKRVLETEMYNQQHILNTNHYPEGTFILLIRDHAKMISGRKRLIFVK